MKKQTPHKPLPKSVKWLWGIVFAPFALLLLLLLLTAAGLFGRLPSFEEFVIFNFKVSTEIVAPAIGIRLSVEEALMPPFNTVLPATIQVESGN